MWHFWSLLCRNSIHMNWLRMEEMVRCCRTGLRWAPQTGTHMHLMQECDHTAFFHTLKPSPLPITTPSSTSPSTSLLPLFLSTLSLPTLPSDLPCPYHLPLPLAPIPLAPTTCPYHLPLPLAPTTCPYHLPLPLAPTTCPYHLPLPPAPTTCPYHLPLAPAPSTCP